MIDAKTFAIVLKEPFGLVLEALGKVGSSVPFMMPKRVAMTDPNKQIEDYIGSGPFIFKKDEWKAGEKVVYVKNPRYKPRAEPPSMLAGGKVVKVDRVEWHAIPDPSTAMNALIAGEIDLIETPPPDLFPILRADKNVALYPWNVLGSQALMRFNVLHPPFDNPKARQAAMYALAQEDLLHAQYGDPEIYKLCNSPFICGTTYGKEYGDFLIKAQPREGEGAAQGVGLRRHADRDAAPDRSRLVQQFPPVAKQQLERAGFKVDVLPMDWQTVISRRARKDPPAQGGWNVFFTTNITIDVDNPGTSNFAAATCEQGMVRLAVRSRDREVARRLPERSRSGQAEGIGLRHFRPRYGPGRLCTPRPVQSLRRLSEGSAGRMAARGRCRGLEHQQEELTAKPLIGADVALCSRGSLAVRAVHLQPPVTGN